MVGVCHLGMGSNGIVDGVGVAKEASTLYKRYERHYRLPFLLLPRLCCATMDLLCSRLVCDKEQVVSDYQN
ncbi:hypothetical protein VNO77_14042 [Canavalia gladiata]|uniref:Uncharacterized protein n=1 Tax=Canavalia gladiata TaxID=3824 RepID=A0AAN9M372_CANGL